MKNAMKKTVDAFLKWFNRGPIELPAHHEWVHAKEQVLLEWKLRARNYNTFVANIMCTILLTFSAIVVSIIWNDIGYHPFTTPLTVTLYAMMLYAIIGTTHQKVNCAFRFSTFGLELCTWKEMSKATLAFIKLISIILGTACLIAFAIMPGSFLISLGGAGGIGLFYLYTINSKAFRERDTRYTLENFPWENFKEIHIDRRQHLISLEVTCFNPKRQTYKNWPVYLFAPKKNFERNLAFVKQQLPDLPVKEMRISVLHI